MSLELIPRTRRQTSCITGGNPNFPPFNTGGDPKDHRKSSGDQKPEQQAEIGQTTAEESDVETDTDLSRPEDDNEPFYVAAGDELGHRVESILEELADFTSEEVQPALDFEEELELFDLPADAEHFMHWF